VKKHWKNVRQRLKSGKRRSLVGRKVVYGEQTGMVPWESALMTGREKSSLMQVLMAQYCGREDQVSEATVLSYI
jgi:hypothetical protein